MEQMLSSIIIVLAIGLLPLLLFYEKKENRKRLLPTKSTLSFLFILAAVIQPHLSAGYYYYLLGGLILCLGGDVCLVFSDSKMFLTGLVFFLMGHVLYIFGFFHIAQIGRWTWTGAGVIFIIGAWIYLWLRPHLESMKIPVLIYSIVISIMLTGAWTIFSVADQPLSARVIVFGGALSFYISDIFVARDRFLKKEFLNRSVGLPLYYTGQFLLAFSVGVVR